MPHPFKVVQTPSLVVLLYETSTNQTFRQVFLDGRPPLIDPQPTWLGYSVGRWEGDTLVVDTTGSTAAPGSILARATRRPTRRA